MGIFTGRKNEPDRPSIVIASAARVKLEKKGEAEKALKRSQQWQTLAWDYFDTVGEVKYAGNFLGNACARLRLYVGKRQGPEQDPAPLGAPPEDDPDGDPVLTNDEATAVDALDRLRAPVGGHSEILRRLAINLSIPGEGYLVGLTDPVPTMPGVPAPEQRRPEDGDPEPPKASTLERWEVHSTDELQRDQNGDGFVLKESPTGDGVANAKGRRIGPDDYVVRVHLPHPRYSELADSPMRGVLAICEELLILERAVRAAGKSRIAGSGLLLVPEELSAIPTDITRGQNDGEAREEDDFLDELITAMTTPIADEGSASAIVPLVVKGKALHLKELRHLSLVMEMDAQLDTRTERALKRLAQGLNVPAEVVLGIGGLNHWSAWQVEDSTFKAHLEPLAITICEALTDGYLHAALEEANVADFEDYVIWYDPTKLVIRPNRSEDADSAHKALVISDRTYRDAKGFDNDDAPDDEELQRRVVLNNGQVDPAIVQAVLQALYPQTALPEVAPGNGDGAPPPADEGTDDEGESPPGPPADGAAALLAAGSPRRALGDRLTNIDARLRDRLQVAAEAALRRALERVGGSLRSRLRGDHELKNAVRNIVNPLVASTLGMAVVAGLGVDESEMLDNSFDGFGETFEAWTAEAQEQALQLVPNLEAGEDATYRGMQAEDRAEAWTWLRSELLQLARVRLYEPNPVVPDVGEVDADGAAVPYGVIREAVARAGGATGADAPILAAGLGDRLRSAFGVAYGWFMSRVFRDHGVEADGFEWDYGDYPRFREFEPHADLDGAEFGNFDDDTLRNFEDFPPEPYYIPGDHDGCKCNFVPKMVEVARAASAGNGRKTRTTAPNGA